MGRVDETESIGISNLTVSDTQLTTPERAARVNRYREMKENMVTLINAPGPLKDPDAMDDGVTEKEWEGQQGDVERLPDPKRVRKGWRRRWLLLGFHNRVCKTPEQRVRQGTGERKREGGRCMRALRRARR